MRLRVTFEDALRGSLGLGALGVVGYLAIAGGAQIAPLAAGALISLLGAAVSYLFRGKVSVEATANPPAAAVRSAPVIPVVPATPVRPVV